VTYACARCSVVAERTQLRHPNPHFGKHEIGFDEHLILRTSVRDRWGMLRPKETSQGVAGVARRATLK
jgi:hypothetical protein